MMVRVILISVIRIPTLDSGDQNTLLKNGYGKALSL